MSEEMKQQQEQQELQGELAEIDLSRLSVTEQKRYKARLRKRRQRAHEKQGIPSNPKQKLEVAWTANRAALMADPEKTVTLEDRLFDFYFVRKQMRAAIDRIRRGIHPEAEQDGRGRFFDCIADDVLEHVEKYGLVKFFPPEILHLPKPSVMETMKTDPLCNYRINFGLDIDGLSNLEYEEFFEMFFRWYLRHRDDVTYDFDWEITDRIYREFEIPEKFLSGIFARPSSVWTKLHERRTGILVEPVRHTNRI